MSEHIELFYSIVCRFTNFTHQNIFLVQLPDQIHERGSPNLQILYDGDNFEGVGHWICSYFDGTRNHIYDSINKGTFGTSDRTYLRAFYGNDVDNEHHYVQQQPNSYDCGVFAIAVAVSICYGRNPEKEMYTLN